MAAKTGGLGRGLGALIRDGVPPNGAPPETPPATGTPLRAPLADVHPGRLQPRQVFDAEALAELAQSIRRHGVLQPLLVRPRPAGGYELIAGERRLRAAAEAGLESVPVLIMDAPDEAALEVALIENLQRENLNPLEEADGYQVLLERFGLTHEQLAERVGKSRSTITNALRLRELPGEVRALVSAGQLSAGHAKILTGLAIPEEQVLLARRAAEDQISVRELERILQRQKRTPRARSTGSGDLPPAHVRHLAERLQQHFGTRIQLVPSRTLAGGRKAAGSLQIEFFSNDDLDRILELLGVEID